MSTDVPSPLDVNQLPDDPALLKRIIAERNAQLARAETDKQAAVKEAIEATTAALLKRFYGPKNETFDPRQLLLFGERIDQLPLEEASITAEAGEEQVTRRVKKKRPHGRSPLPEHLPRIDIEHDITEDQKPCPCCGEVRCEIGQEISEQLEYLPASFKVLRHIRHKYACRQCDAVWCKNRNGRWLFENSVLAAFASAEPTCLTDGFSRGQRCHNAAFLPDCAAANSDWMRWGQVRPRGDGRT